MDNSITEKSPAKINLFLKILNRREDNYHNIRTGITSINLCDEIEVKPSNQFNVEYRGAFAPENNIFDDCIIKKIFSFLNISPPNISFSITKNFPYQAGLGSASSNAATVIKILENLEIINKKNIFDYTDLGSDIPFFLNQHDSLVRGRGDLISNIVFPKYFFLITKPNFNCSTKKMYDTFIPSDFDYKIEKDIEEINDDDNGNDFEKVIKKIETDFALGFFGLIMQLGPIANWGLNIDKKTVEVDTEKFDTNQKGIYAVGDICSYPGKLKLILSGFHEGALAARACFKLAKPNEKYRFEFTTTSTNLLKRLGKKD